MDITITEVQFMAYGRACREYFADESWEKIHNKLFKMCSTYEPIAIAQIKGEAKFQPLEQLKQFNTEQQK